MSAYREYQLRVLVPCGGVDLRDLFVKALHDAANMEHAAFLVSANEPVERRFSELTAYEAEEITFRERLFADDDDEDLGDDDDTASATTEGRSDA